MTNEQTINDDPSLVIRGNELKTVKDIEEWHGQYDKITDEAIKWVKDMKLNYYGYKMAVGMFAEFHNITEDDLKVIKDLQ